MSGFRTGVGSVLAFCAVPSPSFVGGRRGRGTTGLVVVVGAGEHCLVLAHYEASELLKVRGRVNELVASITEARSSVGGPFSVDLGTRSLKSISADAGGVYLDGDAIPLSWKDLQTMTKKGKTGAYECYEDGWERVAEFSEETQRAISLLPVAEGVAPTVVIGGFGMHRIKSSDPWTDTQLKMKALGTASENTLDVCTGLGYTAIALADQPTVDLVTTIELDPSIVNIQRRNPWSRRLFENPKIDRKVGDAVELLPTLPDRSFSTIVHDPPALALCNELYTLEFYKQLRRTLKPSGKLYHYVGDPASKESGRLFRGIMDRLKQAGFQQVKRADGAFGILAR
ncbi:hypothetical protein NDN08_000017 [Rhodosorus marinus]|uniref:PABS domain-containing protein n=1 Tax=Rhodosorus marinus TaxID=101924 RepID=A0AAV8UJ68_9RHOD|nr:hypothetical protein NDN08_000017 [Rhodosorus marinus]